MLNIPFRLTLASNEPRNDLTDVSVQLKTTLFKAAGYMSIRALKFDHLQLHNDLVYQLPA